MLPDDATDLVKRLLRRNPASRLGAGPLAGARSPAAAAPSSGEVEAEAGGAEGAPCEEGKAGDGVVRAAGVVEAEGGGAEGEGESESASAGGGRVDGGGGGFEALKAHPFFRGLEFVGDGQVCVCAWCLCFCLCLSVCLCVCTSKMYSYRYQ